MERLLPGLVRRNGKIHIRKTILGERVERSTGLPYHPRYFEEANRALLDEERRRRDPRYGLRPERTFGEAAAEYLGSCKKKSLGRDIQGLDKVMGLIEHMPLHLVHAGTLAPHIETELARGVSAGTINRDLAPVKRILHLAASLWRDEHGLTWLEAAPLIPMVSGPQRQPYPLSRDEERRFLSELPDHLQRMVIFAIHTGCRQEEVCGLRWAWERREPVHHFSLPAAVTKMQTARPVVLSDSARQVVEKCRGDDEEHVFVYAGKAIDRMRSSAWRRAWREAGLPFEPGVSKGPHNLRHTCGQRLRDAGVPEWTVADVLGHRRGQDVTRLYAEPTLRALQEAVNAPYRRVAGRLRRAK